MDYEEQKHPRGSGGRFTSAHKLEALADSIDRSADVELARPRLSNTARRAQMASHAEGRARGSKNLASLIRGLASRQRDGSAGPHLSRINSRAQVEALVGARLRAMVRKEHRGGELADHLEFPHPRADHYDVRWLAEHLEKQAGEDHAELARQMRSLLPAQGEAVVLSDPEQEKRFQIALSLAKKTGYKTSRDHGLPEARRLRSVGITDRASLASAVSDLDGIVSGLTAHRADPVKDMERALIGRKIPDFFPTPPALAAHLVSLADVQPGYRVLEPSAGKGDLAEAIRTAGGEVTALERDGDLVKILRAKKIPVAGHDALAHGGQYDRIVMNPPFSNNLDAAHVRHAFENNLAPGGRLVSLVGAGTLRNSSKVATEFRGWLASVGGRSEMLPPGRFSDPREAFRTTDVSSGLVVIDRPPEKAAWRTALPDDPYSEEILRLADGKGVDRSAATRLAAGAALLDGKPKARAEHVAESVGYLIGRSEILSSPLADRIGKVYRAAGMEPPVIRGGHEMTLEDFARKLFPQRKKIDATDLRVARAERKQWVVDALARGEPVDAGVMAEYPELAVTPARFSGPPSPEEVVIPPGAITVSVSVTRQEHPWACGPACLAGLSRVWNHPWGEPEWTAATGCDEEGGCAPQDVVRALTSQGFGASLVENMGVEALLEHLRAGRPVLCPVKAWGGGHWVVAVGQGAGMIFVQDPGIDPPSGHRTLAEWDGAWHDEDRYGRIWHRTGIVVTPPPAATMTPVAQDVRSSRMDREYEAPGPEHPAAPLAVAAAAATSTATGTVGMALDPIDRWLVGFRKRSEGWDPYVPRRGKWAGLPCERNPLTGSVRLARTAGEDGRSERAIPTDFSRATFTPAGSLPAGVRVEPATNDDVIGVVHLGGRKFFYKGIGEEPARRERIVSRAAEIAGVLTPAVRQAAVPGAPVSEGQSGGVVTQWLDGYTLGSRFRESLPRRLSREEKGAVFAGVESSLRPGEVDRMALFGFVMGLEDRHVNNFMVVGDRLASIDHDFSLWAAHTVLHNASRLREPPVPFHDPGEDGIDNLDNGILALRRGGTIWASFDRKVVSDLARKKKAIAAAVRAERPDAAVVVERHFRVLERMAASGETTTEAMRRFLSEELANDRGVLVS